MYGSEMPPFEDAEARDLIDAIVDAEARQAGRRFVVTVETMSGRSVTGQVVSTEEARLGLVDDNQTKQVDWDEIVAVRVQPQ